MHSLHVQSIVTDSSPPRPPCKRTLRGFITSGEFILVYARHGSRIEWKRDYCLHQIHVDPLDTSVKNGNDHA